jgi:hypothetical protein
MHDIHRPIHDQIMASLAMAGNEEYLARQAEETPSAYLALLAKAMQLAAQQAGVMAGSYNVSYKIVGVSGPHGDSAPSESAATIPDGAL